MRRRSSSMCCGSVLPARRRCELRLVLVLSLAFNGGATQGAVDSFANTGGEHVEHGEWKTASVKGLRALVIGGTGFMGHHAVPALLDAGVAVELLTDGRSRNPWGKRAPEIVCERHQPCFAEILRRGPWDLVLDFPAYSLDDIKAIPENKQWIRHYIFPSSDDVYMVCDKSKFVYGRSGGLLEESATRPTNATQRSQLDQWDTYGSNKKLLEDSLADAEVNFTALRLPDVWGPHDSSGRFATFLRSLLAGRSVGLRVAAGNPVFPNILSGGTFRPDFVFAKDVAQMILLLLDAGPQNSALNVAVDDAPTVKELVVESHTMLQQIVGPIANLEFDEKKEVPLLSTDIGALDISRATALGFRPTPWKQGWDETVTALVPAALNESMAGAELARCIKACDRTCFCEPLELALAVATSSYV